MLITMIALPSEMGIAVPTAVVALLGLLLLGGCALLAFIAILAALKNRPGIAAFTGALLVFGLLLPAAFTFTYFARHSRQFELGGQSMHVEMPAMPLESGGPIKGKIAVWPMLLIAGVVIAVFARLFRRSTASIEKRRCAGGWWPVPFLVALPVLFFLFFSTVRSQRSESFRFHSKQHPAIELHQFAAQHEEVARRAATIEAELHRKIAEMDIHELMDRFDAPRIVISGPRTITVSWLAHFPHPLVSPVKSAAALLAAADASAQAELPSEANGAETSSPVEQHADAELDAEAEAAVKMIAAETEWTDAHASSDNDESKTEAQAESIAAASEQSADYIAPQMHDSQAEIEAELSTPIATARPKPKTEMPRPKWIDESTTRIGEVRREVLVTEEWSTAEECEHQQDLALMFTTYLHIQRLNGVPFNEEQFMQRSRMAPFEAAWTDHHLHELQSAGITLDYVHREIAKEEYLETVDRSIGEMKKLYTLVEFTPSVDRQLRQYWDAYQRQAQFAVVGLGAGGVLGLLGLCYGLLKLDTWTKGYYTKRLFLGVPAAIIGLGTLLAMMVSSLE